MREACSLIWTALVRLFRTRASLVAEILVLRHQINIQRRHLPKRQTFRIMDRLIFAGLYRLAPTILNALAILKPETVMKWHRVGFRSFWRWKSRRCGGRPTVPPEIRKLIREMSIANPLWGTTVLGLNFLPESKASKFEFRKFFLDLSAQAIFIAFSRPLAPSGKHPHAIALSSDEKHPSAFRSHQFRGFRHSHNVKPLRACAPGLSR